MLKKFQRKVPFFIETGYNLIDKIPEILSRNGLRFEKILLLGDDTTFKIGGNKIFKLFKGIKVFKKKILRSDESSLKRIKQAIKRLKPNLVIGFGGGKVLDVAKLAAGENKLKFLSIPTILSNDGIASPVSVITDKNGVPVSHLTHTPYGVIIDLSIIRTAPIRHLRAGVGDLISNLSAVFDCKLARRRNKEKIDDKILTLAEIGPKRLLECNANNIKSKKFLESLSSGLVKSGLAMCLCGSSRPASGSEHKISHSMDYLFPKRKALHGEQVGISTIFTMAIQKNPYQKMVLRLFKRIKFPIKLSSLGINKKDFVQAALNAKNIRPQRYTILEDKRLDERIIQNVIEKLNL